MKFEYSPDVDILRVILSDEAVDGGAEVDGVIYLLSEKNELVELEVQDGKTIVERAVKEIEKGDKRRPSAAELEKRTRLLSG